MYQEHYGFSASPFQLMPDARFFYSSQVHGRALAHLTYGLSQGEGFIVVTGEVGAGKTMLVERMWSQLDRATYTLVQINTTQISGDDLFRMAMNGFGVERRTDDKAAMLIDFRDVLRQHQLTRRRCLLVVDEAQSLSIPAIEELRMLSNITDEGRVSLQTILLGQPQFRRMLASPDLSQLRQRVLASYHLGPLSEAETRAYIRHRLTTVGWTGTPHIDEDAYPVIHEQSGGIPRRINRLCGRVLLLGALEQADTLTAAMVRETALELHRDLEGMSPQEARPTRPPAPDLTSDLRLEGRASRAHDRVAETQLAEAPRTDERRQEVRWENGHDQAHDKAGPALDARGDEVADFASVPAAPADLAPVPSTAEPARDPEVATEPPHDDAGDDPGPTEPPAPDNTARPQSRNALLIALRRNARPVEITVMTEHMAAPASITQVDREPATVDPGMTATALTVAPLSRPAPTLAMASPLPGNAMTVDVEDWFQVQAYAHAIPRTDWDRLPCRVEANTDRMLAMFDDAGVHATFFTLGWVAERHPHLIRRIVAGGHELASHGYGHALVHSLDAATFRADVGHARRLLEDIGGVRVLGYRAPTFSIGPRTPWAWDVLAEEGYVYSSSVYPVRHDLYGEPDAPRAPHRRGALWEVPMTTLRLRGRNLPVSGGGWFRLAPYPLSRMALRQVNQNGERGLFYTHPWEIDPKQPRVMHARLLSRFRHRLNLDATENRLRQLLADFRWDRMDRIFPELLSG